MKIALTEELEYVKAKLLGTVTGSPGQQLMVKFLSRKIGDQKVPIAEAEGWLKERGDVLVPPFTGPPRAPFPQLEAWVQAEQEALRAEIKSTIGLGASLSSPGDGGASSRRDSPACRWSLASPFRAPCQRV